MGGNVKNYIAHQREEDGNEQLVEEHLLQVAQLASEYGEVFGCKEAAYVCGLLHDIGKYSEEFYKRIKDNGPKCDHATAGAQKIKSVNSLLGGWLGYAILGHHGGMPDYGSSGDIGEEGTYRARMIKKVPDYSAYKNVFQEDNFLIKETLPLKNDTDWGFKISFLVRMIYSCLVDADYIDTERFMSMDEINRLVEVDYSKLQDKLNKVIDGFKQDSVVNQYRKKILDSCLDASSKAMGMFQLTVPTGGGKTIASVAFAIKHLLNNKKKLRRIIYVIPYCSIIEQNAKVFTDIFGEDMVLEHHSNYDFDNEEDEYNDKKRLASENWDMPIVVTTNVQFFDSLYSNKPSRCRKLHNIAGSVIIFDEVQAIPSKYMKPCMRAVEELVQEYNCSAVLCSATQPKLDTFFYYNMPIHEMCYEPENIFKALKRTKLTKLGEIGIENIIARVEQTEQVLVVLNKRDTTKTIYGLLKERNCENIYHLSTYMCPQHRKEKIEEIRTRLKNGLPCRVISTNLIEAGVDLDFQDVYRELIGIDSIIQAAGRANREGKRPELGEVYVFTFREPEYRVSVKMPLGQYIEKSSKNAKIIIDKYDDIFSTEAIEEYYTLLYKDMAEQEFDGEGILKKIKSFYVPNTDDVLQLRFKELAKMFQLIDEETYPVLVPYNEKAKEEIASMSLPFYIPTRKDIRSNQKYMVNLRKYEYDEMLKAGRIRIITDGLAALFNEDEYSMDTGLEMDVELGIGLFF